MKCLGLIFLFVLPHPLYNHKTYFSENALLPGLVTGEFNEQKAAQRSFFVYLFHICNIVGERLLSGELEFDRCLFWVDESLTLILRNDG